MLILPNYINIDRISVKKEKKKRQSIISLIIAISIEMGRIHNITANMCVRGRELKRHTSITNNDRIKS